MFTVRASPSHRMHPRPARGPLLPSVTDKQGVLFSNILGLAANRVSASPIVTPRKEINTLPSFMVVSKFFQFPKSFPVLKKSFLFRRQLHRPSFPCANAILLICGEPVISSLRQTSLYPAFLTDSEPLIRSSIFFRVPAPSSSDLPQQSTIRA